MHTKHKGNAGQFAVALALSKLGYSVFTEEGDISKIDLIAEKSGKILRFQCKAITPVSDCLRLPLKKTGPNYCFHYNASLFDYFGLYDLSDGSVYAVPATILKTTRSNFSLRKTTPKNNQSRKINYAADYTLSKVLLKAH